MVDLNLFTIPDRPPPTFSLFQPASVEEIKHLILSSPKSTCSSDLVPSNLLPLCINVIASVMTRIVNLSLSSGKFPKEFKYAVVMPLLKKPTLDFTDLKNYRPISNLSFLLKLVKRIIANHLLTHLSSHDLLAKFQSAYCKFQSAYCKFQSAYCKFHSSKTALLYVLYVRNDILVALEAAHSTTVLQLDLSATFETIDQNILIYRLQHCFGISSTALNLLSSFLSDRFQTVIASNSKSQPVLLEYDAHKGACWDLYSILYTLPLNPNKMEYFF